MKAHYAAPEAFSRQAPKFDAIDRENLTIQWMRQRVYGHVDALLAPGSRILELNAGTGIDALHFARQGHSVHATEMAEGMLDQLRAKVTGNPGITVQACDFTRLDTVKAGPFDMVFSNFGGLNCIPDLRVVARHLPGLLRPGGLVTWVLMPRFCPWEVAHVLKGNFRLAFRRFRSGGAVASVEGMPFRCYYFSGRDVMRALGPDFRPVRQEHLGLFVPPPYHENFPIKWPRPFKLFQQMDGATKGWPILRNWGDHVIITAQYRPE